MESTPRLKKKSSWMGNVFRTVVVQSALTAKAAIDSVREHIGGSPMPTLPETPTKDTKQWKSDADCGHHSLGHHRTYSAKSAIASIRSHLPRRSLEHKRHSFSDLLSRADSCASSIRDRARHKHAPSQADVLAVASGVPLPSSPIDVPEYAPSLSLDLSPIRLFTATSIEPEQNASISQEPLPSYAEHTASMPIGVMHSIQDKTQRTASIPVSPSPFDAQPPVAEARESLMSKLKCGSQPLFDGTGIVTPCQSPLPGTNLSMEFDEHDLTAAVVKEPDSVELTKKYAANNRSLDALTSTPARSILHEPTSTTVGPGLQNTVVPEVADTCSPPRGRHDSAFMCVSDVRDIGSAQYSGPPSPDRHVTLAIRTKGSLESSPVVDYPAGAPASVDSSSSSPASERTSPLKRRNHAELTVALLRERTNDITPLLEQVSSMYESSRQARRSLNTAPDQLTMSRASKSIGLAITTDAPVFRERSPCLALPVQSRIDGPRGSTAAGPPRLGESSVFGASYSPAADTVGGINMIHDNSSAWLDSSSSIDHDDGVSIHNHLSLLSCPDRSSSDEYSEVASSVFQY